MQSIKVTYNNEVRRLQVPTNSSFRSVQDSIRSVFTGLNSASFSLVWTDDEGDKVTVSSDPELNEAIRVLSNQKAMARFEVTVINEALPREVPGDEVHFNVTCDECGMSPIYGDRFKCTVRNDFDLCAKCEASRVQPFPMVKMTATRNRLEGCHGFRGMHGGGRGFHGRGGFPGGRGFSGFGRGRGAVHRHVRCDDCGVSPIVGNRFKCTYREDFDLCEGCEAKNVQPYPMIKIVDPTQAPVALVYAFNEEQQPHPRGPGPHNHPEGHHERFAHCGRGGAGRGGFRCGRGGPHGRGGFGCPLFNRVPAESGPLANVDLTPEGFAALGRLSGYHNLDFTHPKAAPEASTSQQPSADKETNKPTGEARAPVAEPVTVEALKAINPSLTSLIESFLHPITTPEQRAEGEKHVNEILKAVTNVDGLPAGVYPFPQQCGDRRRNHHRHFEERRQRRQYEQTTRDLNDEDAELQRAISECFTPSAAEEAPASTSNDEELNKDAATAAADEDEDVEDIAMPSAAPAAAANTAADGDESDTDSVVFVDTPAAAAIPSVEAVSAPVVSTPAAPAVVSVPPSALPSFIDAARREAAVSDEERWRSELRLLASMGFYETVLNLSLLKKYVPVPGGESGEGMQRVVQDLLSAPPASFDV